MPIVLFSSKVKAVCSYLEVW